jgi:tetratricopeptide (TPR) repeat protein
LDAAVAAYVAAGKAAAEAQDFASADEAYTRALTHRPNSGPALLGLARIFAAPRNKKPLQALERYQAYMSVTGQHRGTVYEPELYVEMGRVYADASLWHQALKSYREALKNGVDTDEVAALLASCHMALGEADEAFKQAEKAISKNKTQPAYYRLYAELLFQRNAFVEAAQKAAEGIAVAKERLAKAPDERTTLSVLNECYGTYLKALETIVSRNPADLQSRLTLVQTMRGHLDVIELLSYYSALDRLRDAPARDRQDVILLEEQIRLEKMVRHKDLRSTCEQLLKSQPDNKLARETLAALASASQPSGDKAAAK